MSDMPNFGKYTMSELDEAYRSVDSDKYPDNYKAIVAEIDRREKRCAALYTAALTALKDENNDEQGARELFENIIKEYPGTQEANRASKHLTDIKEKNDERGTAENGEKPGKNLKLEFNGSAQEYFRIWIVNLCLTLLTLGIFSAWAKVRKKRYIYSNLTLDGTPFQYLAQPVPILKGRIIAAGIFLIYYLSSNLYIPALPYILVAGMILAPWVFVQSVSFNSRYTAFRNISFRFTGSYLEAFLVLSAWGIIPAIVVGMVFDFWGQIWIAAILFPLFGILFPWWLKGIKNFIVTRKSYGKTFGEFSATGGQFFQIYFLGGLIIVGFGIATTILAFMTMSVTKNLDLFTIIFTILSYGGYLISYAYIQANMTNTVWNRIQLGPIRFNCTLGSMDMAKLYITNALGIVCTAGLLIPWAVIRTIDYRVEQTQVQTVGDVSQFQARTQRDVAATGAELTDFFDMDLSL